MGKKILAYIMKHPKTYAPLIGLILLQLIGGTGIEMTDDLKHSMEIVCLAGAGALMRRNMVKETNMKDIEDKLRSELLAELTPKE